MPSHAGLAICMVPEFVVIYFLELEHVDAMLSCLK